MYCFSVGVGSGEFLATTIVNLYNSCYTGFWCTRLAVTLACTKSDTIWSYNTRESSLSKTIKPGTWDAVVTVWMDRRRVWATIGFFFQRIQQKPKLWIGQEEKTKDSAESVIKGSLDLNGFPCLVVFVNRWLNTTATMRAHHCHHHMHYCTHTNICSSISWFTWGFSYSYLFNATSVSFDTSKRENEFNTDSTTDL